MSWLAQLDWRAPAWGLLALQPLVLEGWARWRSRTREAYADAALRPWAVQNTRADGRGIARRLLRLLAWALFAGALAGPRLPLPAGAGGALPDRPLHDLTIYAVLGISPAMRGSDIAPNRLARARLKLLDLIQRLHGERLGLIVYSGAAGLLSPPSDDPRVLRDALDLAQPDLVTQAGDDPAAALTLALQEAQRHEPSAVLLVSDAAAQSLEGKSGEALRQAVAALARAHVPLYVLGVATPGGAVLSTAEGGTSVSRPDGAAYAALAASTGGRYESVTDDDADLRALYGRGLARLPAPTLPVHGPHAWRELYPWLLAPALALMLLLYLPAGSGRFAAVLLAAGLLAPLPRAHADPASDAQACYAQLGGYEGQLGAGAAAWQMSNYGDAARYFSEALMLAPTSAQRLDALYDLGNALYGLGNWAAAAQAFGAVLRQRPLDARARHNLAVALRRLKDLPPHAPAQTDLRARRGTAVAGQVDLDWDSNAAIPHLKPTPLGPLIDRGAIPGAGARLQGTQTAAASGTLDIAGWESGFKKMQWLRDRRTTLARGLLGQDSPEAPQ